MTTLVAKLDTRKLDELIQKAPDRASQIVRSAAFEVQAIAQTIVPIDTHALQNSIEAVPKGPFTWWVQDGVEYGIYQELGTSRMAAQPFMVPAVEQVGKDFERMLAEVVA